MRVVARDRGAHRVGLAPQALVVDARAAADPIPGCAAEQRVIDRRRRRRVADAHLAQHEQVGLGGERLHAEGDRRRAGLLVERRLLGDVAGRLVERQFVDFERDVEGLADLIDRRAAGREIRHHRLRDRRRIGGDALRDDAMIAGEDRDQRMIDMRAGRSLPARQPFGDLLEPPERARGLGQLRLALARRRTRRLVRFRHFGEESADIVEGAGGGGH